MLTFLASLVLTVAPLVPLDDAAVIAAQTPFYPSNTCVVSGEDLGSMGDAISVVADGRLFKVCCKGCVKKIHAETAAFSEVLDAAVMAKQGAHYPLETCPISGEKLDGAAKSVIADGRLIKVCCGNCAGKAKRDPSPLFAKLDAAWMAAQQDSYPLETCAISGEPLGDNLKEVLYGTSLVKFCCGGCVKKFRADPTAALAVVHAASMEAHGKRGMHAAHGEAEGRGHEGHGEGHDGDHEDDHEDDRGQGAQG